MAQVRHCMFPDGGNPGVCFKCGRRRIQPKGAVLKWGEGWMVQSGH